MNNKNRKQVSEWVGDLYLNYVQLPLMAFLAIAFVVTFVTFIVLWLKGDIGLLYEIK